MVPGFEEARRTGQPRAKAVRLKESEGAGLGETPRRSRAMGTSMNLNTVER